MPKICAWPLALWRNGLRLARFRRIVTPFPAGAMARAGFYHRGGQIAKKIFPVAAWRDDRGSTTSKTKTVTTQARYLTFIANQNVSP